MSKIGEIVLKTVNKVFPLPIHPFNLQNNGVKTYAEWEFEKGLDTLKYFLDFTDLETLFKDKTVLDIGCGAAGKTVFYATQGVKNIYGVDRVEHYKMQAEHLAAEKSVSDKFRFVVADATSLPFQSSMFDTIIMNDFMEHASRPEAVLSECYRVLKEGGRLYVNSPPYNHPYGAHLSDVIGVPWVHVFFSDQTLINVYKDLVKDLPDAQDRINLRFSTDNHGKPYISYINKMTIKKFNAWIRESPFNVIYYKEVPLRNSLSFLANFSWTKEYFVKMLVAVLEKPKTNS
ncbi:class I SAM-dependent methyltransferase [Coprothermobacter platensis]|uniref:class I SAM-dependent methyltransferase n=1 Tax=Coprothermobacter platensis TaxID=108819 RepID=UPI00037C6633|nr:class I SAM-dependent methyltransferase [Coprothermobacter platensis]